MIDYDKSQCSQYINCSQDIQPEFRDYTITQTLIKNTVRCDYGINDKVVRFTCRDFSRVFFGFGNHYLQQLGLKTLELEKGFTQNIGFWAPKVGGNPSFPSLFIVIFQIIGFSLFKYVFIKKIVRLDIIGYALEITRY